MKAFKSFQAKILESWKSDLKVESFHESFQEVFSKTFKFESFHESFLESFHESFQENSATFQTLKAFMKVKPIVQLTLSVVTF